MLSEEQKKKCENVQRLSRTMPLSTALLLCGASKEEYREYESSRLAEMFPEDLKNIFGNFTK